VKEEDNKTRIVINEAGELVVETEWKQHPAPLTYKEKK
jgi:hypothetical protein